MLPFKPMIGFDKEVLNGITNKGKRERMIILCDENKFYYYCNRKNKEEEREREEKEREEKERNNRERELIKRPIIDLVLGSNKSLSLEIFLRKYSEIFTLCTRKNGMVII